MKSVAMRVAVLTAMLGPCVGAVQAQDKAPPPIGTLPTDKVVEMLDRGDDARVLNRILDGPGIARPGKKGCTRGDDNRGSLACRLAGVLG